jgi:hypothetical protein
VYLRPRSLRITLTCMAGFEISVRNMVATRISPDYPVSKAPERPPMQSKWWMVMLRSKIPK